MAVISPSSPARGLLVTEQPPPAVYQTVFVDGRQDSSTPLEVGLRVTDAPVLASMLASMRDGSSRSGKKAGGDVSHMLTTTLRRFDGVPLMQFNPETHAMERLTLTPATFRAVLHGEDGVITVSVHRKHLPVSSCFGDAPFRFAFVLTVPSVAHSLVAATQPFTCCSKEPKHAPVARGPPKRERGTPAAKPVTVPDVDASPADAAMHAFFAAGGGLPAPLPPAAASDGEDVPVARAGVKRRAPEPVLAAAAVAASSRTSPSAAQRLVRARMAEDAVGSAQIVPGLEAAAAAYDSDDEEENVFMTSTRTLQGGHMELYRAFSMSSEPVAPTGPVSMPKPSPLLAAIMASGSAADAATMPAFALAVQGTTLGDLMQSLTQLL